VALVHPPPSTPPHRLGLVLLALSSHVWSSSFEAGLMETGGEVVLAEDLLLARAAGLAGALAALALLLLDWTWAVAAASAEDLG